MVFSSNVFLCVFLPVVFLAHTLIPGLKARNGLLILASLLFYAYGEPIYVILMLVSILLNYLFGLWVGGESKNKKIGVITAVIVNLGVLAVFKYASPLIGFLNESWGLAVPFPKIALPIGISFFTFQALSYVIDVYRGNVGREKNLANIMLYISFFPQLIAGPIVKYHDIHLQLRDRSITAEGAASGLRRFSAGLAKKVLIANTMAGVADSIFASDAVGTNVVVCWIGALAYMMQIYFDFSGYSDMAIGMGRMFGFRIKENFNYPYISESIQEFWRRWHISLSGWFKEYLYIPLGGNRKGSLRTSVNKIIVFFCTGLWHGANLTFVFWGLYHGFFLMLEQYVPKCEKKSRWISALKHVYTVVVVCVGFVFFRAETLTQGFSFVKEMFTGFHYEAEVMNFALSNLTPLVIVTFAAAVLFSMPVRKAAETIKGYQGISYGISLLLLVLCMMSLASNSYNPFIYFRF